MTESQVLSARGKSSSHDKLWWFLLLPLLAIVLLLGLHVAFCRTDLYPYLLGVAGFSIAYALHFFSVSCALCGIYIGEPSNDKYKQLREKEYNVVSSAMCALSGGLGVLLAGGLCAINNSTAHWVYVGASLLLFGSVLKYVLFERRWPREVRQVVNPNTEPVDQG